MLDQIWAAYLTSQRHLVLRYRRRHIGTVVGVVLGVFVEFSLDLDPGLSYDTELPCRIIEFLAIRVWK
jgi:hypothetical protein